MDRAVKPERNGWRNETISLRHRVWGWDCPAIDIDWLVIEYEQAIPIAVVEYKKEAEILANPQEANYRALRKLGDMSGLPVFGVRYANDLSWFRIVALNCIARTHLPASPWETTELEWVTLLYKLRGREMPVEIARKLSGWTEIVVSASDIPW